MSELRETRYVDLEPINSRNNVIRMVWMDEKITFRCQNQVSRKHSIINVELVMIRKKNR